MPVWMPRPEKGAGGEIDCRRDAIAMVEVLDFVLDDTHLSSIFLPLERAVRGSVLDQTGAA